ncbi:MAG TPA: sigma-70 family RNA polymerase sigma factor [Gemmataceae bacterium]|nr:sigma-70 family RNA polymerase sigma factor [Gemmataceae bacterium]
MNDDDDTLIARIRAKDAAALAEFITQRRPALLAFVERRLGAALRGKAEPDDVVQTLTVKALGELPKTDFTTLEPFGWLCHLAEQCIVDLHRHFSAGKRASAREMPGNVPVGEGSQHLVALLAASMTTPTQAVVRNEREQRLLDALATFPEEHREVLRLRYVDGLSTKDIAAKVGKTDVAIRVLLSRLIHRLQELLEPGEE